MMNAIDEEQIRNKLIDYMKTINPLVRFNVIKRSKKYKDIYDYVLEKTKHITDIVCKSINRINFRLHISAILVIQHHLYLVS